MKLFIARLFAVILIEVSIIDACAWSGPGHMTVAARNADQACPIFPGMVKRYHWGFEALS